MERFLTKRAKQTHESTCYSDHISTQPQQVLPLAQSMALTSTVQQEMSSTHSQPMDVSTVPMHPFEIELLAIKKKVERVLDSLTSEETLLLKCWFSKGIPLSLGDKPCQPETGKTGLSVYIPFHLSKRRKVNVVENAKKKLMRLFSRYHLVKKMLFQVGPYLHNKHSISLESMIEYRPLSHLLLSFILDDEAWSDGSYLYKPRSITPRYMCASHVESQSYRKTYNSIKAHFGEKAIPLPLLMFSDGAKYTNSSAYGSSHSILFIPLLFSLHQMGNKVKGTRMVSFASNKKLAKSVPTNIKTWLRQLAKSKYIRTILDELCLLTHDGIQTSHGFYVPYIAVITCDIIEMRSITCCTRCPFCNDHTSKNVPSFNINDCEVHSDLGIQLSMDLKNKILGFEEYQSKLITKTINMDDHNAINKQMKEMQKYSKEKKRKMIINAFDVLNLPSFLHGCGPQLHADRMHALILNEISIYLSYLLEKIEKQDKQRFLSLSLLSEKYKYFPFQYMLKHKDTWRASEISRVSLLLVCLFFDHSAPMCFDKKNEMEEHMLILMINFLKESTYIKSIDRDNIHVLLCHFFDISKWRYLGAPRYISSSTGESALANVKLRLRNSNKGANWSNALLNRIAVNELMLPMISQATKFNRFLPPLYKKVYRMTQTYVEVAYMDCNRDGLLIPATTVTFECVKENNAHYAIAAKSYNIRMLINKITDVNNAETGVYHLLTGGRVLLRGTLLDSIPNGLLSRYVRDKRGIPHPTLWTFLSPTLPYVLDLDEVMGGCHHVKVYDMIFSILNHEFSHIVTGKHSTITVPDRRFE